MIVPTRNEAGNVAAAVARTPVMGSATELIFVEGHSTDDTWAAIQGTVQAYDGPLKLRAFQQTGKGKGDAVRLGFAHATGDVLMILDADLTVPPEDLPSFYEVLTGGHADFVQGTRLVYPMEPGAMRFFNKIGNVAFSELFEDAIGSCSALCGALEGSDGGSKCAGDARSSGPTSTGVRPGTACFHPGSLWLPVISRAPCPSVR